MIYGEETFGGRPQARSVGPIQSAAPTLIGGIGVHMDIWKGRSEGNPGGDVGLDGPPPKILEARLVPVDDRVLVPKMTSCPGDCATDERDGDGTT